MVETYRSDVSAPAFSVNVMPESETGSLGSRQVLPATPDNSIITGVNAGSLEIQSDQTIEAEQPCNITNSGVEGEK